MNFKEHAKSCQEAYLNDLNTLVSIESTRDLSTATKNAPFGQNCRKVLDAMLDMAKKDGFVTKDIDGYAGVIEYGEGEDTLGILGHLDIVPLGEDWTKDPLKVTVNDGYVFGRGVMDDKGPTLAAYYALKLVKELNIPLKNPPTPLNKPLPNPLILSQRESFSSFSSLELNPNNPPSLSKKPPFSVMAR